MNFVLAVGLLSSSVNRGSSTDTGLNFPCTSVEVSLHSVTLTEELGGDSGGEDGDSSWLNISWNKMYI